MCTLPLVRCPSSMGQLTSSSDPSFLFTSHPDLPCTAVSGLTPLQGSPSLKAAGGFPSGDSWEASGSSERMVPSSDTWDFSVSLSIPVFKRGKAQTHKLNMSKSRGLFTMHGHPVSLLILEKLPFQQEKQDSALISQPQSSFSLQKCSLRRRNTGSHG